MVFNDKNIDCFSEILANNCPTPDSDSQCKRSYNSYIGSTYDIYGHKICFFCKVFICFNLARKKCPDPWRPPVGPPSPPLPA
jgi:hypothetical protein